MAPEKDPRTDPRTVGLHLDEKTEPVQVNLKPGQPNMTKSQEPPQPGTFGTSPVLGPEQDAPGEPPPPGSGPVVVQAVAPEEQAMAAPRPKQAGKADASAKGKKAPGRAASSAPSGLVHYTMDDGKCEGECRPAMVVRTHDDGSVNLAVFTDGTGDYTANEHPANQMLHRRQHVKRAKPGQWGSWHEAQED